MCTCYLQTEGTNEIKVFEESCFSLEVTEFTFLSLLSNHVVHFEYCKGYARKLVTIMTIVISLRYQHLGKTVLLN